MNLNNLRQEYCQAGLSRDELAKDPLQQFERWFIQAQSGGVLEPNAMQLATVSPQGKPTLRTVLLKAVDEQGFVFFTHYQSQKAAHIASNAQVSLLFFWKELERQVEITGVAKKISSAASLQYFSSRPRSSQLGAWASAQSRIIPSRQMLLNKLEEVEQTYANQDIPKPDFWGGYCIEPSTIEFWQGRPNRLHDRFEYRRKNAHEWQIIRLSS